MCVSAAILAMISNVYVPEMVTPCGHVCCGQTRSVNRVRGVQKRVTNVVANNLLVYIQIKLIYIYRRLYAVYIYIYSGYKHFTLIDEKTSIPLSVRGAYIATTAPYLNIWCLQYFPLIQRRQRNRYTPPP